MLFVFFVIRHFRASKHTAQCCIFPEDEAIKNTTQCRIWLQINRLQLAHYKQQGVPAVPIDSTGSDVEVCCLSYNQKKSLKFCRRQQI